MPSTRLPIARILPLMIGAAVMLGASLAAQADATLDKIEQRHRLVVGVLLSGGPFGSIDPKTQKPEGLNVDMAQDLGRQLGADVELVPVLPANRVQFLQQGKVDLLIANMEWTAERGQQLGFVPTPFYRVGGTAAVLKDSKITRWEDLKGQPVCTSQGSSYVKPLTEFGAELKAFKSSSESLLALRGNNCVAAVHDATLINPLVADSPEWQNYRAFSPELNPAPSVIWTRPGETDTQAKLDAIVKGWHRTAWLIDAEKRHHITPASPALVELHDKFQAAGA
ncbi:transporter substrate-binding domain-containing protein [Pseudomonas sp. CFBP 13711]|uniref:transporter substrate-binding domain-containing protein n=1 Tax=unclassified Pseudomonas TaxID=196821 RepID=UPI0017819C6E|nr:MULTISPECIES: transporter substrate-binding domain-containing protein [unclassified Pseudomonas]MBD8709871.1 transporter substrate-binding domain-containing protein [Pseudomonas sp. CFBP 13711]MBD8715095.1 transporter substrate-binding domain-containing protein [Pseudomonas sp. CFBP 13715]